MRVALLLLLFFCAPMAAAQVVCEPGTASAYVDAGATGSGHHNNGRSLRAVDAGLGYEAPLGSGLYSGSVLSLMVAGMVDGRVHLSGGRSSGEWLPGPYGASPARCREDDRIFSVRRSDLNGSNPSHLPDVRDWPHASGAPVMDGNGNPTDYAPAAGDLPGIVGDQSIWWQMHDAGPAAPLINGFPQIGLTVNVQISAAISRPWADVLAFRYVLRNDSGRRLESAYVGFYVDLEIGYYWGDHVGVDTLRQVGYHYDDGSESRETLGPDFPAYGLALVRGPVAARDGIDNDLDDQVDEAGERLRMSAFIPDHGRAEHGPYSAMYDFLRGNCPADSSAPARPVRFDLTRPEVFTCTEDWGAPSRFWFPGDPVTGEGWTERSGGAWDTDGLFILASGPFSLDPGDVDTVDVALVWAKQDTWQSSLQVVRNIAGYLVENPSVLDPSFSIDPPAVAASAHSLSGVGQPYPIPADGYVSVPFEIGEPSQVEVALYDAYGRRLRTVVDRQSQVGLGTWRIDTSGLPSGVYLLRSTIGRGSVTSRVVVAH